MNKYKIKVILNLTVVSIGKFFVYLKHKVTLFTFLYKKALRIGHVISFKSIYFFLLHSNFIYFCISWYMILYNYLYPTFAWWREITVCLKTNHKLNCHQFSQPSRCCCFILALLFIGFYTTFLVLYLSLFTTHKI